MKGVASSSGAAAAARGADSDHARARPIPLRRSHVLVLLRVRKVPLPQAEDWSGCWREVVQNVKEICPPSGDSTLAG